MNRKRWIIILIILGAYCIVAGTVSFMAETDYERITAGQKPRFTLTEVGIADGGSVEYHGLGYLLISHHGYSSAPRPKWATGDGWAYDIGPEMVCSSRWMCPWLRNKKEIRTVVDEEGRRLEEVTASTQQSSGGAGAPQK
jgi:hypothetical protein